MEDALKGMETTESEGLDNIDCTEGHSDCKAGREDRCNINCRICCFLTHLELPVNTATKSLEGGLNRSKKNFITLLANKR